MSNDGGDTVRVNPPPAETGETISPTCASLETTIRRKRGADRAIIESLLGYSDACLGSSDLLLGKHDFGFQAIGLHRGVVERLLGLNPPLFLIRARGGVRFPHFLSCTSKSAIAALRGLPVAFAESRARWASESSRVARSWP